MQKACFAPLHSAATNPLRGVRFGFSGVTPSARVTVAGSKSSTRSSVAAAPEGARSPNSHLRIVPSDAPSDAAAAALPTDLRGLVRWMRAHVREQGAAGQPWQVAIDMLRPHLGASHLLSEAMRQSVSDPNLVWGGLAATLEF